MNPSGLSIERHAIEKDGGTHEIVVMSPMLGESTQGPAEEDPLYVTPNDCWPPPLELHKLADWSGINPIRAGAIRSIVRNTVGMELAFGPSQDMDEPTEDHGDRARELHVRLDTAARRDNRSRLLDFADLMERVKRDEEECGNGAIEVSRSRLTGEIDGLFYVPGARVRRLRDRTGWVMLDIFGTMVKAIRFYNFGEKVAYNDDGTPTGKLDGGGAKRWDRNELLVFQLHTSESRDYGLPRDVAMALEYLGDKLAAESNISFFDSSGTPPTVLFVQAEADKTSGPAGGGRVTFKVPQDTALRVANTLKSDGGHRHRVAIIPLPTNSKVDKIELGTQAERDMGFVSYRQDLRQLTLASMQLPGIFVALDGDGRYTAEVQRALGLEQLFDPEQSRYERMLRSTLLRDLGYVDLTPKYKRLAVEGDEAKRTGAVAMSTIQSITNREFRRAHGYGPLPEVAIGDELVDGRKVVAKMEPVAEPPAPEPAEPGTIVKATPPAPELAAEPGAPEPAVPPVVQPPATTAPPPPPTPPATEIALADVTYELARQIGKVPVGWNDALVDPPSTSRSSVTDSIAPSRGGQPVPDALDHRGLQAGIGSRARQRADNVPGTSAAQGAGHLQGAIGNQLATAAGR